MSVVARNTALLLFDKAIRIFTALIITGYVARYLGPTRYGYLSYVLAFWAFFQVIATLGAEGIVVSDLVNSTVREKIIGTMLYARFVITIMLWLLGLFAAFYLDPLGYQNRALFSIIGVIVIFQTVDIFDYWFQSQQNVIYSVVPKISAHILSSLGKILVVFLDGGLELIAIAATLEFVLVALLLIFSYRKFSVGRRLVFSIAILQPILRRSWPLMLSGLAIVVCLRIDQFFISSYLGAHQLGIYSAMIPVSQVWYAVPSALAVTLAPILAKKKAVDEVGYCELMAKIFRMSWVFGVLLVLLVSLSAEWIVMTLYGPNYSEAVPLLRIHSLTIIAVTLGVFQNLWIINEQETYISLGKTAIGAFLSVLANWQLIPVFGLTGAAISAVASLYSSAFLSNLLLSPKAFFLQIGITPVPKV